MTGPTSDRQVATVRASLRAELARRGESQTWLANELGESKHWVSRRFAGLTDLSVEALDIPPTTVVPA